MTQTTFNDKSPFIQVMAWCHQTSHYSSQYADPDLCGHIVSLDKNELKKTQTIVETFEICCVMLTECPVLSGVRTSAGTMVKKLSSRILQGPYLLRMLIHFPLPEDA